MNTKELQHGLKQFYGTEQLYRHWRNPKMLYTDGVQYFAEHAGGGAYWFLDIVDTEIFGLRKLEDSLVITLKATGGKAEIEVENDDNNKVVFTKGIDFTDCPDGQWVFYLVGNTILLPSEY